MAWCTTSPQEQSKCQWLAQASLNQGLLPLLSCKEKSSKLDCIKAVSQKEADIVTTDQYAYIAEISNLHGLAFTETKSSGLLQYIVVVKNQDKNKIKSFADLKGKGGCFPEYAGNAWLAFGSTLREHKLFPMNDQCDYGESYSLFLESACMPGAREQERHLHSPPNYIDNLCTICKGELKGSKFEMLTNL